MRRFNFNLKHMLVCMGALLSPQFQLAGVYPLVPALFMTGFVCGVNRSLLFLCSICGLLILAPVSVMVKYALVIFIECSTGVGAGTVYRALPYPCGGSIVWRCYGSGWTVLERTASAGDLRACNPHLRRHSGDRLYLCGESAGYDDPGLGAPE